MSALHRGQLENPGHGLIYDPTSHQYTGPPLVLDNSRASSIRECVGRLQQSLQLQKLNSYETGWSVHQTLFFTTDASSPSILFALSAENCCRQENVSKEQLATPPNLRAALEKGTIND